MRRVVIQSHEAPTRAPLVVNPGQAVGVGTRDTEWPAFVFVTADAGTGWVPARHLSIDGDRATVVTAYDTTELTVAAGTVVDVVSDDAESGWSWCRATDGTEGWVPNRALGAISAGDA
ncbi:SH3 domain-containing protein [Gryllotalpicola daejeonensis]|uniref:SH3 domain-containing protein n=1 Tax=Gryllotalpicola daejeonensis TaxID=993087 RepID=UPI0031D5B3C3